MYSVLCIENMNGKSEEIRRLSLWSEEAFPFRVQDTVYASSEALSLMVNKQYNLLIFHSDKLNDYSIKMVESLRRKASAKIPILLVITECVEYSYIKYLYSITGIYVSFSQIQDIQKSLCEIEVSLISDANNICELSAFSQEFIELLAADKNMDDFINRFHDSFSKLTGSQKNADFGMMSGMVDSFVNMIKNRYGDNVAAALRLKLSNVYESKEFGGSAWDYIYYNLVAIIEWMRFYFPGGTTNKLMSICVYIWKNYDRELSLTDISDRFYVNSSYLSNRFSDQIGMTYKTYVNSVKCEVAKSLLLDSKISEVAFDVGFKNEEYFSKVFKKITGMAPTEYREKIHMRVLSS